MPAPSGYSGTPLLKKLGYDAVAAKGGRALLIGAGKGPDELVAFDGFGLPLKTTRSGPWLADHFFEDQLADGHASRQEDGRWAKVHHLQRDVALEARVNRWGGQVHQQSIPSEAAFPFDACREAAFSSGRAASSS